VGDVESPSPLSLEHLQGKNIGLYPRVRTDTAGSAVVSQAGGVALALGGDCLADVAVLQAEPAVFGLVASDPTVSGQGVVRGRPPCPRSRCQRR
jgi:hypothetical protein